MNLLQSSAKTKSRPTSQADRIFNILVYTVLLILFLAVAYPLIYVVSASVSDPAYVMTGKPLLFPVGINFDGYIALFEDWTILNGFKNSLIYTVLGTLANLILTTCCAYALSRRDLKGRRILSFILMFTIIFDAGIIPNYLVIRDFGLIFTRWALILPGAMNAWYVFIMKNFFQNNIPEELLEAAHLDGCSDLVFVTRIVLPLSGAIIAVVTLFVTVDYWGMFFYPLLYVNNPKLYPIQLVLREILMQSNLPLDMLSGLSSFDAGKLQLRTHSIKYALIVVSSLPLLIAYPFVQKYFVKGVLIGSIKG